MIEAHTASTDTFFDRLTLILAGAEKSGKSRLAATARKPILFNDHDKRFNALAGIPDVYGLTYMDSTAPNIMPTAYSDQLTVLTLLEQGKTLKQIGDQYGKKDWPDVFPKTVVIDSMAGMSAEIMAYNMYCNPTIRREIQIGGNKLFFPKGWDTWNADSASAYSVVMRLIAMKQLDVILIFHEDNEVDEVRSTEEKRVYTGRKSLFPARYSVFNKYFNEIWRISREDGAVPKVQFSPDFRFAASTNLDFSKIPANEVVPNISVMISKVVGNGAVGTVGVK